jgi:LPXTG-motif cell wall-anchored protein
MSVEPQVLGASAAAGGGAAAVASLANTGNPAVVGIIAGIAIIVVLGFVTRAAQRR